MSDTRPTDLVTVDEAARRVERSKSTIRAWVRSGEVVGYREDPAHPENSRLLVSAAAVAARAAVGLPPPEAPAPDAGALREELERLRTGMIDALRANVATLEGRVQDLGRALESERLRAEEWRARALAAEAEREALRQEKGLPWWRRLLGAPAALPGSSGEGG